MTKLTRLKELNMHSNFDRNFRIMQRFIVGFIAIVFIVILSTWVFYGYVAVKAIDKIENTENIPAELGKMLGEFEKARNSVK